MALRLLNAGVTVNVWNRSSEKLHIVIEQGVRSATGYSPRRNVFGMLGHRVGIQTFWAG